MPTELEIPHRGKVWGVLRAEVRENEVVHVEINPSSEPRGTWLPFMKIRVVDDPSLPGPQLIWTTPEGELERKEPA